MAYEGTNPDRSNYYHSEKVLGTLYRRIPASESPVFTDRRSGRSCKLSDAMLDLRYDLLKAFHKTYTYKEKMCLEEEMRSILALYSEQLLAIAKIHSFSRRADDHISEAELVTGMIQATWGHHRSSSEAVTSMNLQVRPIYTCFNISNIMHLIRPTSWLNRFTENWSMNHPLQKEKKAPTSKLLDALGKRGFVLILTRIS